MITPKSISKGTPCIKQASTTLLQYPLRFNQSAGQAEWNLDYYAPRVDPHGTPAMTCAPDCAPLFASQGIVLVQHI